MTRRESIDAFLAWLIGASGARTVEAVMAAATVEGMRGFLVGSAGEPYDSGTTAYRHLNAKARETAVRRVLRLVTTPRNWAADLGPCPPDSPTAAASFAALHRIGEAIGLAQRTKALAADLHMVARVLACAFRKTGPATPARTVIGYRLRIRRRARRLFEDIETISKTETLYYPRAGGGAVEVPKLARLFPTEAAAEKTLATLNDSWKDKARIVPVVRRAR